MKLGKILILLVVLIIPISATACNFNTDFSFGEPEVPTAPPQPPLSQMDSDVMMHILNENGITFEEYNETSDYPQILMMLIILENDPDANISVPEKYSKQFEQMRGIVRERGSVSHKGFEMTMMSDKELLDLLNEKMSDVYKGLGLTLTEDNIFAN